MGNFLFECCVEKEKDILMMEKWLGGEKVARATRTTSYDSDHVFKNFNIVAEEEGYCYLKAFRHFKENDKWLLVDFLTIKGRVHPYAPHSVFVGLFDVFNTQFAFKVFEHDVIMEVPGNDAFKVWVDEGLLCIGETKNIMAGPFRFVNLTFAKVGGRN